MINYGVLRRLMVRKSLLILAMVHFLVSERAGLLEQKIEPRMVTGGNSHFVR